MGIAIIIAAMLNKKILDWIEGYVMSRMLIFGDFVGTVNRSDFLIDINTEDDYFRKFEGQRIQALSLPVKSKNLSTLLGELEVCFQRGWELKDAGKWTSADFDQVYELSQQISYEVLSLRGEE